MSKINAKILKSGKKSSIFVQPLPQSDCIKAKLDVIMNMMNNQEIGGHSYKEVGIVGGAEQKNIDDQGLEHEGPYQVEEA